ncbi:UDP-N-acetylglucosamine 1-carboxyvinyltransferase [Desulfosudis oleivorans]|uniref:UDP-N-acetylglucosamine 1-carboxyvinyltransferase n=1 Tax=Desulfosudis oleivorans (strain DSM 6200 / JCM 39069 / Hxd3) TaxID=96561 RepID=MURA_DESOH|nr:UDP-N-acetylglucosamine 1-carboxyvinyltransferase [Desulfosudis oleivorans]A8ZWM4.1 RecName: Full=UDP-N-acetylglucosamine 1-carboxyvinyltransferase; AltName: Full=Enoylpyruvate transferase; AltName: Full=UDP-N-acetylglucosamine enolpyruvyl transferase; Short=EPT [Desulfosudis oleivorans Hxd3]ABW68355.1 UDP-N-acetylglucosamine 1-carboxyvinyltransferase [Desulfosudis oleivorans Hxd3]
MDRIIVEGGRRLTGTVEISGAKNAALPILASSLLTNGTCTYTNVPDLRDIQSIKELLTHLGAKIECQGTTVQVDASGVNNHEAPYELVRKMRASILVLCPLVARLGRARVSLPGGCAIGERPIDFHLKGLEAMGADIALEHGYVNASAPKLTGGSIYFDVPSVTGTENLLMAAALADGTTRIGNAACEPEVTALVDVLNQMGANITGAGTPEITIQGVPSLNPVSVSIIPDRIETGTFMVAAALTKGDITITNAEPSHLKGQLDKLAQTGARIEVNGKVIRVVGGDTIKSVDVKTLPYPGFPTDMQAQFMVLMSVASGLSIITETIFENRFIHVSELKRMGADITISGNTAMVAGAPKLSGAPVMASDLRASASLVLAGLVADGTTEISRVYHLDRGYENLEEKFERLGASIRRVTP